MRKAGVALAATGILLLPCTGLGAQAAAAVALPNACTLLPAAEIAATTGHTPAALHRRETSREINGFPSHSCTYTRGKLRLTVEVSPASLDSGGVGGPPGMVLVKEPALGSRGLLVYDNRRKYQFATIEFISRGEFFVISSAGIAKTRILAVGRYVYAHR